MTIDESTKAYSALPENMPGPISAGKEWLEETVSNAGFAIDFYPKYHCEFNYIETFWGAAKAFARANFTFDFKNLVRFVPEALASVSLAKIRKFARKSYRYRRRVRGAIEIHLT